MMIRVEEMRKCIKKNIVVTYIGGEKFKGYCTEFFRVETDDEEPMLGFGNLVILQSEIKSIEILD